MPKKYLPFCYNLIAPEAYRVIDGDTVEVSLDLFTRYPHPSIAANDLGFSIKPTSTLIEVGKALKAEGAVSAGLPSTWAVRLSGIDIPEARTAAGQLVAHVVSLWLSEHPNFKVVSIKKDKFAERFIGFPLAANAVLDSNIGPEVDSQPYGSLPKYLFANSLCREYQGDKKETWSESELATIAAKAQVILAKRTPPFTPREQHES